ncbi:hypothetical protein B484DRAFT_419626, partial [Ochromonadaceae sp. CCMP2298]
MGKSSKSAKSAVKAVAKPAATLAIREPPAGTRAALIAASARAFPGAASARLRNTFPAFVPPSTGGSEASDSTNGKEARSQRRSASIAMRDELAHRASGGMVAAIAAEGSGAAQMDVVAEMAEGAEVAEGAEEADRRRWLKMAEALCRIQFW